MAKPLNEFLYKYFAALNLGKMPDPVLDRLNSYIAKSDYPHKDVKAWIDDKLIIQNPNFNNSAAPQGADTVHKYIVADTPDISTFTTKDGEALSDEDLDELYRDLYKTFQNMSLSDDDDTKKFATKYFGIGQIFEPEPLTQNSKDQIKAFLQLISDNNLAVSLGLGDKVLKLQKAVAKDDLDNPEIRNLITSAIQNFYNHIYDEGIPDDVKNAFQELVKTGGAYYELYQGVSVNDTKRQKLRDNYNNIFKTLYKNDKGVYDLFKNSEEKKLVSNQIDKALQKTDYTGKKNQDTFVPEQYKDDSNLAQRFEKWKKDTYEDILKKYVTAHRDNIYIKPETKAIVGALDKAEIKPTDDLTVFIKKSKDIENGLRGKPPFKAADAVKWLGERLKSYSDNGLGNAVKGALRNGHQMRTIIEKLISNTLAKPDLKPDSDDVKQLKTAMEVLSVMQYGTFTSRTMDALGKTDVNLFSDKDLSWNKNSGIKMVTGALDKTIKFGLMTGGYAATAVVNKIRRIGVNFNNSGELGKKSEIERNRLNQKKIDDEATKDAENRADNQTITDNENILTAIHSKVNDTNVDQTRRRISVHEQHLKTQQELIQTKQQEKDNLQSKHEEYEHQQTILAEVNDINNRVNAQTATRDAIVPQIEAARNALANKPYIDGITGQPMPKEEEEKYAQTLLAELERLQQEYDKENQELQRLQAIQANPDPVRNDASSKISALGPDNRAYLNADRELTLAQNRYARMASNTTYLDLKDNLDKYDNANKEIENARRAIQERNENWNKWDQNNRNLYNELMAYWDFLQTGKTKTKLYNFSTQRLQNKMNKNNRMQQMIEEYTKQYAA